MIKTLTFCSFYDEFQSCRPENFSYDGLRVLFEYLEEIDENMELDVIAICCNYSECNIDDVLKDYDLESIEELEQNTTVLKIDDEKIIYQNY